QDPDADGRRRVVQPDGLEPPLLVEDDREVAGLAVRRGGRDRVLEEPRVPRSDPASCSVGHADRHPSLPYDREVVERAHRLAWRCGHGGVEYSIPPTIPTPPAGAPCLGATATGSPRSATWDHRVMDAADAPDLY